MTTRFDPGGEGFVRFIRWGIPFLAVAAWCGDAPAQTLVPGGFIDELKIGVLRHDAGIFGNNKEDGVDINFETRFVSPEILRPLFAPRPHLGVSVNTAGDTSQLYAGLTWSFTLLRGLFSTSDSFYLDASIGGAAHDGKLDTDAIDRKALGSRFLFRESLELGYSFTPSQSISIMLDHVSNANLANRNEGLDNLGIRYGLKF
jgi:lipid A 3-O-deacylase